VIGATEVHKDKGGAVTATLEPGSLVRVIETSDGWDLVARNGKPIGYVEAKSLAKTQ
jgi:hypothetical protein